MPLKIHQEGGKKPRLTSIIAIAAGKGGVGKSTVAVNLALALKDQGLAVGLLDADIYGPSIRQMLPEEVLPKQNGPTWVPALARQIKVMSMAYFRKPGEAAVVRAPIANSLIDHFLTQVEWGDLDVLLIDFPPGTGDIQLTLCQKANLTGAVIVTTPQEVALLDVRKAIQMFEQVHVPILGIIENMSYYLEGVSGATSYPLGRGGGERLAKEKGIPLMGQIPLSPSISTCGDAGTAIYDLKTFDAQVASKAFGVVAELLKKALQGPPDGQLLAIDQIDTKTLRIAWSDGKSGLLTFGDLQKQCPCAACVDEFSGKRLSDPAAVAEDVTALSIQQVGRYAIQIRFSSGCSSGLYTFDMLRALCVR